MAVVVFDAIHFGINDGATLAVAWNMLWPLQQLVQQVRTEHEREVKDIQLGRQLLPWPQSGISIHYIACSAIHCGKSLEVCIIRLPIYTLNIDA